MKKISAVMTGVFLMLFILKGLAQSVAPAKPVNSYPLAVTFNKTTNLVFPYAIKSVDRGSRDILVQKAIGVENILQVKAGKQGFTETNLTVVTADGSLYPYLVSYTDSPVNLNLLFSNPQVSPETVAVFDKDSPTDEIALRSKKVIARERTLKGASDHKYDIVLDMKGLFVHGGEMYFQLALQNNSAIDYDVQSLRFFIRDQKKSKRTASQEVEVMPDYRLGNADIISHLSEQTICIAVPKFTIPDKKYLAIELMEKNGGRHLSLYIRNKQLVRAGQLF
ncbi:conjugative transposon protein TraN [Mucilaginibacter mali]|uniref:Conjugative transposon protein TraN n=1 Tax=Mucilaginibacter mali TaxID=2740462 RepID=A0A7D4UD87_9SPHI|nr:conjugative transposon protein TraN [Mucilaginibacter mali]QKJ30299.1 conjugative transposon protein TraN [Mucilaginibacter mali]